MQTSKIFLLSCCSAVIISCGEGGTVAGAAPVIKRVAELSVEEKRALDQLTLLMYQRVPTGDRVCSLYSTTHYRWPQEQGSPIQLQQPITVLGYGCDRSRIMVEEATLEALRGHIANMSVVWGVTGESGQRRLRIQSGVPLPWGGDMVVIFPFRVSIANE